MRGRGDHEAFPDIEWGVKCKFSRGRKQRKGVRGCSSAGGGCRLEQKRYDTF